MKEHLSNIPLPIALNSDARTHTIAVLVSADTEWRVLKEVIPPDTVFYASPFGDWFSQQISVGTRCFSAVFLHGGWGKIAAAASAQYAIDTWNPFLLVNIGTCGGFEGRVRRGDILLVEKTLVYDIIEKMGDPDAHLAHYTTELDLSWLQKPYPLAVTRTTLVSADKDLDELEIPSLETRFGAIAGDWESGAIAFVAQRNQTRCLILKGVSDIVSTSVGEAYVDKNVYIEGTRRIMPLLLDSLPAWLEASGLHRHIE